MLKCVRDQSSVRTPLGKLTSLLQTPSRPCPLGVCGALTFAPSALDNRRTPLLFGQIEHWCQATRTHTLRCEKQSVVVAVLLLRCRDSGAVSAGCTAPVKHRMLLWSQGDSGGPLMCRDHGMRWVVVGVVSYGSYPCFSRRRTQIPKPSVFTRLDYYVDWIHAVMRQH